MATLHVRNVPEPLYDALRARAEREGRSIGSQTCILLEQSLLVETLKLSPRRGGVTPGDRFMPSARDALAQAGREAIELGQKAIDTEHVLLALVSDEESVAGQLLEAFGVNREAVLARATRGSSTGRPKSPLPFTPAVKDVLELALREALSRGGIGQGSIDTHHVLLGLTSHERGHAAQILRELGVETSMVRAGAVRVRAPASAPPHAFGGLVGAAAHAWEYQTIDLTGDSKAWSQQLNDAAADGWELFSVTESERPRAILRRAAR